MTDIELAALTELVATERFGMQVANEIRARQDQAPAYDESVEWETRDILEAALKERGIIEK